MILIVQISIAEMTMKKYVDRYFYFFFTFFLFSILKKFNKDKNEGRRIRAWNLYWNIKLVDADIIDVWLIIDRISMRQLKMGIFQPYNSNNIEYFFCLSASISGKRLSISDLKTNLNFTSQSTEKSSNPPRDSCIKWLFLKQANWMLLANTTLTHIHVIYVSKIPASFSQKSNLSLIQWMCRAYLSVYICCLFCL